MTNKKREPLTDETARKEAKEYCNALLDKLDEIAREWDGYEYGLPMHDEDFMKRAREVIYRWVENGGSI